MNSPSLARKIWAIPATLSTLTVVGLLAALLGEALFWKAFAWAAISVPVGVALWFGRPQR
jgi:hypothetical protein